MKVKKADLEKLENLCQNKLTQNNIEKTENFTETVIAIAKECISKNSTPSRRSKPWFNDVTKLSKEALQKFNKVSTPTTFNNNK